MKTCSTEGCGNPVRKKGFTKQGSQRYDHRCGKCADLGREWSKKGYRKHKKDKCERCSFVPEDPCQLDVDHIDGNHHNNDTSNLQTLCANCHRLKTFRSRDGMYKSTEETHENYN